MAELCADAPGNVELCGLDLFLERESERMIPGSLTGHPVADAFGEWAARRCAKGSEVRV